MASVKVKFRASSVDGKEGTIYYQIIHERRIRQILSGHHVHQWEWDDRVSSVIVGGDCERRMLMASIREQIRRDVERLMRIVGKLNSHNFVYTVDDVISEFSSYMWEYSLFNFMGGIIAKLKQNGKIRTSETYTVTLNSFKKFRQNEDIMLDCLDSETMEAYEAWLHLKGVVPNTISFYIRILRAVYNRAVDREAIADSHPFKHVYTGVGKTQKRALPLCSIKEIKTLDLSLDPSMDFARDMFLMSFYLRGMSFVDMAFLRKSDLSGGRVIYRRRKTGQQLRIGWTREMQSIVDKYPENATDYLLPIIRRIGINERCAYRNMGYNINHSLKKIGEMMGIGIPLTLYVARHSWASAAKAKGIPLSVISEGMGHDSEATTRIYLASLDTSVVDKANSIILSSL